MIYTNYIINAPPVQDTMGKGLGDPALLGQFNWLCRSCVADNPVLVTAAARQAGCPPRRAVEVRWFGSVDVLWMLCSCV